MATQSWKELMEKAEKPQGGGKLLPKALYRVQAMKLKVSEGVAGKKDKVSILWKILVGDQKDEQFWDNWTVSPESPVALGIFFENLEKLGGSLDVLKMGGNLTAATKGIIGQVADANLDHREWNGNTVNNITFYRKVVAGSEAPATVAVATSGGPVQATLGSVKGPF